MAVFDESEEPKKKLVPFTWIDVKDLIGETIFHKHRREVRTIITAREDYNGILWFGDLTASQLLNDWIFFCNEPCGKEVEE